MGTTITREDVISVAKSLHITTLSEEDILLIVDEYESEQIIDPTSNWSEVVETQIYSILNNKINH